MVSIIYSKWFNKNPHVYIHTYKDMHTQRRESKQCGIMLVIGGFRRWENGCSLHTVISTFLYIWNCSKEKFKKESPLSILLSWLIFSRAPTVLWNQVLICFTDHWIFFHWNVISWEQSFRQSHKPLYPKHLDQSGPQLIVLNEWKMTHPDTLDSWHALTSLGMSQGKVPWKSLTLSIQRTPEQFKNQQIWPECPPSALWSYKTREISVSVGTLDVSTHNKDNGEAPFHFTKALWWTLAEWTLRSVLQNRQNC